jgi:hypothetical protein
VAQVVEAQRPEPGGVAGGDEPAPQRRCVEVAGDLAGKDRIVGFESLQPLEKARKGGSFVCVGVASRRTAPEKIISQANLLAPGAS